MIHDYFVCASYFSKKTKQKRNPPNRKAMTGQVNEGAVFDFPSFAGLDARNYMGRSNIDISYNHDGDTLYYRRCNTLPDLNIAGHNSLPHNFTMRGLSKNYAMSDCCSIDSGFALSNGFDINPLPTQLSHTQKADSTCQEVQIEERSTSAQENESKEVKTENFTDPGCTEHDADSVSYGSYALSCPTLGLYAGYDSFHSLDGVTDDEVDV